jgi:acetyl-CoA synthase
MWMPKELKEAMAEDLKKRCEELDTPDFFDKIATEDNATTPEELMEYMAKVGHPAASLPPLLS